jgi:malate dehydrogenase
MSKLTIIGAGMLGGQAAFIAAMNKVCDNIALIDVVDGLAAGKALDIVEAMPLFGSNVKVVGGTDYALCKDSDVIIITAGIARKPGMTREDLIKTNASIMASIIPHVKKNAPNSILIIVSNPVDAMVYLAYKLSGFGRKQVIGMAGVLDTTRFKAFVSEAAKADVGEIEAMVLGSHGDLMVPIISQSAIGDKHITKALKPEQVNAIVERTRKGGEEIVNLLKTGSAFFAPAASAIQMASCILSDKKEILPCLAYLEGEYGIKGMFAGVPVKLGRQGVVEVHKVSMNDDENRQLEESVAHIRKVVKSLDGIV